MGKIVLALFLVLGVSGCAQQLPPLQFAPQNVGVSSVKLPAEVRSITVSMAPEEERTGDVDTFITEAGGMMGSGNAMTDVWRNALQESLDRMAIFTDRAPRTVSIAVKVLKMDVPAVGLSLTTDTMARYEIINRQNGDIIFSQDITASGTCPADYAFLAAIRARESINRSVQNNVLQFLQSLETVDMERPMFPAPDQKTTPTS